MRRVFTSVNTKKQDIHQSESRNLVTLATYTTTSYLSPMSRGQSDKYKILGSRRSNTSICCPCWTRKPWYFKMAVGISGFLALAVVGVLVGLAVSGPLHASCKIDWFVLICVLFSSGWDVHAIIINKVKVQLTTS